ncbi:MAG TPA: thiamine pyrophosphate-binding protein, partial [Candidatus Acidoferrum sp.]|nr:thiamine pyrophosphate-binding protein [Candidatus Acidoferrum sp.]
MPTTSDTIASTLKRAGVRRIFGLPGGEIAEVMGACHRAGLPFVLTRHENAACIMAGVTGELTRAPGVALATVGPGATNLVNGVANAFLERAPLLVISAQLPTELSPILPHQRIDLEAMFRPITKWSHTLTGAATAATVQRALDLTVEGRPGPVYLCLPSDIARQEDQPLGPFPVKRDGSGLPSPQDGEAMKGDVAEAARMISRAKRPLAMAGIGLDPAKAQPALLRWIEATGIPIAVTPKAKGLVPEDHRLFTATSTGMAGDTLFVELLQETDLLIGIGFDPVEAIRTFYVNRPFLSIAKYSLADGQFAPDLEVVGDVGALLEALQSHDLGHHTWAENDLKVFRRRMASFLTPSADRSDLGLSPARVVGRLRSLTPRQTILTVDTGAHKLLTGQVWPAYEPLTYFVSHGLSTMGYALPAAIAAKLERPERPVVAVMGDGGLAMVLAELETAARLHLSIPIIVLSDRSLYLIRMHQERKGFEAGGVDFGPIDFAGIAAGFGARGFRATSWLELDDAVATALRGDRPSVIEVPIDPADYHQML